MWRAPHVSTALMSRAKPLLSFSSGRLVAAASCMADSANIRRCCSYRRQRHKDEQRHWSHGDSALQAEQGNS